MHYHVLVKTMADLTDKQKEMLREFEAIYQSDAARHNPRAKSWMSKV